LSVLVLLTVSCSVMAAEAVSTPPGQTTTVVNGPNNPVPFGVQSSSDGPVVPVSPKTPIPIGTLGADGSVKPVSPTAPIPIGTVGANGSVVPVSPTTPIPVNVTVTPTNPLPATSGDYTQLIASGSATAGHDVTDLFRGDLTQYKTVKLIIKCTQGPCQFVTGRVSEEFDGQSMLIDAFGAPFGSDLVTVHFYDLPGSAFVVQVFNSDPGSAGIHFVLLGRRN
jgi:hypothetical protein